PKCTHLQPHSQHPIHCVQSIQLIQYTQLRPACLESPLAQMIWIIAASNLSVCRSGTFAQGCENVCGTGSVPQRAGGASGLIVLTISKPKRWSINYYIDGRGGGRAGQPATCAAPMAAWGSEPLARI